MKTALVVWFHALDTCSQGWPGEVHASISTHTLVDTLTVSNCADHQFQQPGYDQLPLKKTRRLPGKLKKFSPKQGCSEPGEASRWATQAAKTLSSSNATLVVHPIYISFSESYGAIGQELRREFKKLKNLLTLFFGPRAFRGNPNITPSATSNATGTNKPMGTSMSHLPLTHPTLSPKPNISPQISITAKRRFKASKS